MAKLNRRDFNRLTTAAFSGMLTGTLTGCGKAPAPAPTDKDAGGSGTKGAADLHVCKGLNACKGLGADGKNACAGQGACATTQKHDCAGLNACKGQGGCAETAGSNACKGMGKCAVPLKAETWQKARQRFEETMTNQGKKVGPAPGM